MPRDTTDERGLMTASDDVLLLIVECLSINTEELTPWDHYNKPRMQNLSTLNSLTRTCRRLYHLASPVLYRTYFKIQHAHTPNPSLRLFLRALLLRPALRIHVRTITVTGWGKQLTYGHGMYDGEFAQGGIHYPRYEYPKGKEPIAETPEIMRLYRTALDDALPKIVANLRDRLYDALCQGLEGAQVALLMALASNLSNLWLCTPSLQHNDDVDLFTIPLQQAVEGTLVTQNFAKLTNVIFWSGGRPDEKCLSLEELASNFLQLPSLDKLQLRGRYTETMGLWACPPRSSSVHQLTFLDTHLSASAIGKIVDSCAAPSYLEIGYGHMYRPPVNWDQVSASLKGAKAGLEELLFQNSQPLGQEDLQLRASISTFGPFTGYNALRRLIVPQHAIFKAELSMIEMNEEFLPPNLEYLSIFDCDTTIVAKLDRLIQIIPLFFKSLKKLHTNDWLVKMYGRDGISDKAALLDSIYQLKQGFRDAKVRWEMIKTHMEATDLDISTARAAFGRGWLQNGAYSTELAAYCEATGRKVEWYDLKGSYQTWHPS